MFIWWLMCSKENISRLKKITLTGNVIDYLFND